MTTGKSEIPVLALDGPSGSGKGAVGVEIAQALSWNYLDSGALYRIVGLQAEKCQIALDDAIKLAELAHNMDISMQLPGKGEVQIILEGEDVSETIRGEIRGQAASRVAAISGVREGLVGVQKKARQLPGLVADGRDMGSVIFPEALLKVYLTASVEVRTQRRYKQLIAKGFDVTLPRLRAAIERRDEQDTTRASSPLAVADDAVVIDTSPFSLDEVVARVLDELQRRLAEGGYVKT